MRCFIIKLKKKKKKREKIDGLEVKPCQHVLICKASQVSDADGVLPHQ
jgi:hypothetical protein